MKNKMMKISYLSLTALVISVFLFGCGGGSPNYASESVASESYASNDSYATDDIYSMEEPMEMTSYEEASGSEYKSGSGNISTDSSEVKNSDTSRKIIKTVNINAETEEFDKCISNIRNKVEALGGYVETSDIAGRSIRYSTVEQRNANITARIPAKNLDEFLINIAENTNITNKSESSEDVTLSYADTKARISSLRTEQQRLNELILEAQNIETIIALENRLAEVRYEIESYESKLRTYDNKIDYSTVYLYISEVVKYTEPDDEKSYFERISDGFAENLVDAVEVVTDFIAEVIINLPFIILTIIILAIIIIIVILLIKLAIYIVIKILSRIDAEPARKLVDLYQNYKLNKKNKKNKKNTKNKDINTDNKKEQ